MTDRDREVSGQLVRLVQIIFGFVLAQSLSRYDQLVLHPLGAGHWLGSAAVLVIYITTILSWIDWHTTMSYRPYNLGSANTHRLPEQIRLFSDVLIVLLYAYLLLSIADFQTNPSAYMGRFLLGFPLVFIVYSLSGMLRRITYGSLASNLKWIIIFTAIYAGLYLCYVSSFRASGPALRIPYFVGHPGRLNMAYLATTLIIMLAYRYFRRGANAKRRKTKSNGLTIAFDVDGVLANQIVGVLPRLNRRYGLDLSYTDITDWRLPIADTDIATEILRSMEDPAYILAMPAHQYARETLDRLYSSNHIQVITARPREATSYTAQWLENNGFTIDGMSHVKEKTKSFFGSDVLVDDYVGNIYEYLSETSGTGILVDQPWNRDRSLLQQYIDLRRLFIVTSLIQIPPLVAEIKRERDHGASPGLAVR